MRSRKAGRVCDGLWYLGYPESGVYWLQGTEKAIMISGGMSYIGPTVVAQLKEFGLGETRLDSILILHSHFDHIGIIPFMLRRNPEIRILGSARAWNILSNPRAIETINQFSRTTAERAGQAEVYSQHDLDWPMGITGEDVAEGDILDLGNLHVHIYETPGHSSCSISAYVPELNALMPSDGGGIPFEDTIVISANSNFTKYQQSLDRLSTLDVDFLCADHFGYIHGQEAKTYLRDTVQLAKKERAYLETVYSRTRDVDTAAKEATEAFYAETPNYFLSKEIYQGVARQIMRHIAQCMDKGTESTNTAIDGTRDL